MPRFLDTTTGEFRWIADSSTVTYAILSHTWTSEEAGGEQTYEEVRKIWKRVRKSRIAGEPGSILNHPDLCVKIKEICKIAREAGYKLVWIDSACIDKSSSAELAEAINSMFNLYRLADVCYVYLADVPENEGYPGVDKPSFRRSRWHRRGWTLQELVAPQDVVFLTASWTFLGTKRGLVSVLFEATGIDCDILLGRAALSSASVARRMSWAALRETTRVEDEAYSLLGIFGVHLSPIYGEGRNAFLRLQEEIMRTAPDHSIFAWGAVCTMWLPGRASNLSFPPDQQGPAGLLATSPREFAWSRDVRPICPTEYLALVTGSQQPTDSLHVHEGQVPPLRTVVTPEGVQLKALTIDVTEVPGFADAIVTINKGELSAKDYDHCLAMGQAHRLLVLRCTDQYNRLITLALFQPSSNVHEQGGMSIATHMKCRPSCAAHSPYRVVCLEGKALEAARQHLSLAPVKLSLLRHSTSSPSEPDHLESGTRATAIYLRPYCSEWFPNYPPPVGFAPSSVERMCALGYSVSPLLFPRPESAQFVAQTSICSISSEEKSSSHAGIVVRLTFADAREVLLGLHSANQSYPRRNISICFSVTRVLHVPPSRQDGGPDTAMDCQWGSSISPGCEMKPFPVEKTNTIEDTSIVPYTIRRPARTVAQAEFTIPASLDKGTMESDWGRSELRYSRILRLAVECPLERSGCVEPESASISNLWLAIEISDVLCKPT